MRLILLAAAALTVAVAQPPAPNFSDLKTYLGLTDSQITSIQQIRQQAMANLKTDFQAMQQKEQALHDLLESGTADAATVGKLVLDIETLRKQNHTAMSNVRTQELAILTTDQKTKLQTLGDAEKLQRAIGQAVMLNLMDGTPGGGPGFPGGPGGPGMRPAMHRGGPGADGPAPAGMRRGFNRPVNE